MQLFKYQLNNDQVTLMETLSVKQNKSNYSLLSNPSKRIPFTKVNAVNPEDMTLYLLEDDLRKATQMFAATILNQADVYRHVANTLLCKVKKLQNEMEDICDKGNRI